MNSNTKSTKTMPLRQLACTILLFLSVGAESPYFLDHTRLRLLDPPTNISIDERIIANQYFQQRVDNFNPTDHRVWNQRYHINEDFYNESVKNHVFLLLGGEWEATTGWISSGGWRDSAREYGALMFYLEHRYYGESHPFEDLSTENLQYLNAHQALEDAAKFIEGMNQRYNISTNDAKWIVFGGSYAGTLASWLRHKYPHLVAGAVDSSGPLEAVLDFHQYYQVVKESLATHSESCINNVNTAFVELEGLIDGGLNAEVIERLDSMFQLCQSIALSEGNEKDISTLFNSLAGNNFAYIVQYDGLLTVSINTVCNVMNNETVGTPLERLAEVNRLVLQYFGYSCLSYDYEYMVTYYQSTAISASAMGRQWLYQTCTEYGFYQTSSQVEPIFGSKFAIDYYTDLCADLYGSEFNETLISAGIEDTNVRYGGVTAPVSNVVHFHGRIDPWHALGKLETTEDVGDTVLIVDGVSHCASMYSIYDSDSEDLAAAKREIHRLTGVWLGVVSDNSAGGHEVIASVYLLCIGLSFYLFM